MASLAVEGMVSSLSKVSVIVESIWSGDRDRREGLNGGRLLEVGFTCLANLEGIGCNGLGGGRCFTARL